MKSGIIYIADNLFETILASSFEEQQRGLMYLDPPVPVMSFLYPNSQINKFWMKNTKAPLDIVFSNNGIITQICKGEPYSTAVIGDDKLSDLIVELPYGTVFKLGIKLGNKLGLVKSSIK